MKEKHKQIGAFILFGIFVSTFLVMLFITIYAVSEALFAPTHKPQIKNITEIEQQNNEFPYCLTITAYTISVRETDNTPRQTATMEKPIAGKTCAVSRDLLSWLGGRVYIEGVGVRRVNDLMNKRFANTIDIVIGTRKEALAFGKRECRVVFLGR